MKKLFLLPIFALLLGGCSINDLIPNKNTNNDTQDSAPTKPEDDEGKKGDDEGDKTVHVSSISLKTHSISILENEQKTLTYTINPTNADNKFVTWSTSNSDVASVTNGVVKGLKEGTASITVKTVDGNKEDSCSVTVSKKDVEYKTEKVVFDFNEQGYTADNKSFNNLIEINDTLSMQFSKAEGATEPALIKYNNKYSARMYPNNTLSIDSSENEITKVEFTFASTDPSSNPITSNPEGYEEGTWNGSSTSILFTAGGTSSHRRIASIGITYKVEDVKPEDPIDLGVKSIAEVKDYIANHPVKTNGFGNGVNENCTVTIKGFALAKIDLLKTKSEFGLDVSLPGKVIMADETDSIGVATQVNNQGTSLWGKINDYVCLNTSKYTVTGYISQYLGHPEILVQSFSYDKDMDISWDYSVISKHTTDLVGFYQMAENVNYNCAGHGYGDVITINNLKCYYSEADGQGKRYYNFTDGTKNIRVNAYNLSTISVDSTYNVTGIISLKDLSPIIIAFNISPTLNPETVDFDYESVATNISIAGLKTIKGSQDDTSERYPDVINAYGTIYKTTGYLTAVEEGGKYYIGISDSYIERSSLISGKSNAMANYGISLIKNDNFWNTTEEELYLFNPVFDECVLENKEITVYYVTRQLSYQSEKPMWEILLIPQFLENL